MIYILFRDFASLISKTKLFQNKQKKVMDNDILRLHFKFTIVSGEGEAYYAILSINI